MTCNRIRILGFASLFCSVFILNSCSGDDPTAPPVNNEHAPPTTMTVELVKLDASGNSTSVKTSATVRDTSVVKGKARVEGTLLLDAGAVYKGSITLFDESKSMPENVTSEIENEKDGHIFLFTATSGIDNTRLSVSDKDKDSKGSDVGLTFKVNVATGPAATGFLNVVLRHYDGGNKNDTAFDTDINSDFPVQIRQ